MDSKFDRSNKFSLNQREFVVDFMRPRSNQSMKMMVMSVLSLIIIKIRDRRI